MKRSGDYLSISLTALWAVVLVVSLGLYVFTHSGLTERVLFFPRYGESVLEGEPRRIPAKGSMEEDIVLLVRELVLGPFDVHYDRVLPKSTDVRSVLLREDTLYIDFSLDPVLREEGSILSFSEQIEAIKRSVRFNFPNVERIYVSFRGETPELTELK